MPADRIYNVLFLCTGNSARSILGEALLNHVGSGRFRAFSAGSMPKGQVHPTSLKVLGDAGISIDGLLMRLKDDDWNRQLQVNLTGAFNLMRAASRPMMKARGGAIVNVSSVVGEMGNAGQAAYAATKAGLLGLTKSVARELASRNIRVNAVTPGYIDTDMTAALPEAAKNKMKELIPLERLGTGDDVASAVAFLASDDAAYVTGEVLKVNGGMYM